MAEENEMTKDKILVGRPRVSVDFATVLRLRDDENLGTSRMAETYRATTGQYVSRDTMKRRYFEAKHRAKSIPTTKEISPSDSS